METSKISVQGRGKVTMAPDTICLKVTVHRFFVDSKQAYQAGKDDLSAIVQILENYEQLPTQAKTIRFDVDYHTENKYDKKGNFVERIKNGYNLDMIVDIELPLDNLLVNNIASAICEELVFAQTRIYYYIKDEQTIKYKAIEAATKDAMARARVIAQTTGCKLGKVLEIKYGQRSNDDYETRYMLCENSLDSAPSEETLPITPEDRTFTDTVNIVWELIGE
jgi:uncharacterized protein YggE